MDVIIHARNEHPPQKATALVTQSDFWLNVLVACGQNKSHTPLADFFRLQRQLPPGDWLLASPMHWQVTHNDAMITAHGESLALTEGLARIWFVEFSQFLAQDGFELIYISPEYYLFNAAGKPRLTSPNLPAICSHSLMPILAHWDSTMYWQGLFTELQMFLSSHPLNTVKNTGKNQIPQAGVAVNGLWFWGGGEYARESSVEQKNLVTDCAILKGFFPEAVVFESLSELKDRPVDESTVLVLTEFQPQMQESLVKMTAKNTVNWYWNNVAYQTEPWPWYKRLFCNFQGK